MEVWRNQTTPLEKNKFSTEKVAKTVDSLELEQSVSGPIQVKSVSFPECSGDLQGYTPCTDPKRWMKYGRHRLTFMERHCPPVFDRKECLIPPPDGYKEPTRWPKSKDECWYSLSGNKDIA